MKKFIILAIITILSSTFSFSQQESVDQEADAFYLVDLALERQPRLDYNLELDYDYYKDVRIDSFACMYWYSKYLLIHPEVFEFPTVIELVHNMEDVYGLMNEETGFETPLIFVSECETYSLEIMVGRDNYRHIELKLDSGATMSYSKNWINTRLENEWEISFFIPFYLYRVAVIKIKKSDELLYISFPSRSMESSYSNLDLYMKSIKPNWKKGIDFSKVKEEKETINRYKIFKETFEAELY